MPAAESTTKPSLAELGGEEGIARWVAGFYAKVAQDACLAGLFPADLAETRTKQAAYFVEFFGGAPLYTQRYGKPFLRYKHRKVRIGPAEREAWMRLALESLAESGASPALVERIRLTLAPIAEAMVNHHPTKKDAYYFNP